MNKKFRPFQGQWLKSASSIHISSQLARSQFTTITTAS